jgi:hypothetical protein
VHSKSGLKTRPPLADYREITVFESATFHLENEFNDFLPSTSPQCAEITRKVKSKMTGYGKKGQIKLSVSVRVPRVDDGCGTGVWTSGGIGFLGIEIKNSSTRKVSPCCDGISSSNTL